MASTSAQPKNTPDQQAEDRSLQGDDHRLPPDRRPQLRPGHLHRAHDAQFAGAFEDRLRGCVAGAEQGYEDGEREQGVDEHQAAMM
jgi:hypothetical protein